MEIVQSKSSESFDLEALGMHAVAYIREAEVDGVNGYSIHAANGHVIGFAPDAGKALGAILQNDMEAVPLH